MKRKASTDIVVVYNEFPNKELDRAIRKALGEYKTGSGFGFGQRDHTATVPSNLLEGVLLELKKIPGLELQKRIGKTWVAIAPGS